MTGRFVWITREQRGDLVADELGFYAVTHAIADAYDAAPDPHSVDSAKLTVPGRMTFTTLKTEKA